MIIVVTGSRTWTNESQIKDRVAELEAESKVKEEKLTIVHGDCPSGADRMCAKWAENFGAKVIAEPADWKNGRIVNIGNRNVNLAGLDRNQLMLDKYEPDRVEAFRAAGVSKGTDHCVKQARKRDIEVVVHHERSSRFNK